MATFYTYYSYEEFGRGYIGYHKCPEGESPESDGYLGSFSDKTFKPTSKIVLTLHSSADEARLAEMKIQEFYDVLNNPHFVNKSIQTGKGFYIKQHTEETKIKMRASALGRVTSEEAKRKQSIAKKGKKFTLERIQKLRGRVHSEKTKEKISKSHLGVLKSPEHRLSISKSKQGDKNPMFNTSKVYSFENKQLNIIENRITVKEMCTKYGLKSCGLYQLKNKKINTYRGWTMLPED